mmetsp:Transcript_3347/g.8272  ORF Transcript_3347/g.8272 Transcript_3347/m.8272 type:complete len:87 (-) Transcript_3347:160-420(-)
MRRVFALCLAVAAIASVHADDEQVASVSEDGVGATNITCLYDPCEVMTEYAVPPLGYAYDGLEPSIGKPLAHAPSFRASLVPCCFC